MNLKKINKNEWMIKKTDCMKVPAIVYANEKLMKLIEKDKTLEQLKNTACLKGIQKAAYVMPDAHQGYGMPIGGVAAFDLKEGIITPGGVGYDINCGVRMLVTNISYDQFFKERNNTLNSLYKSIPSGVGKGGKTILKKDELKEVLAKGSKWAIKNGYGRKEDLDRTEENGSMKGDPSAVSDVAIRRGLPQLGSLGAGNHFLEISKVDKIFDEKIAKKFGINKDNVTIMIHCGSRGLGHQVASDYIKKMESKYGFKDLPDRELINAPFNSDMGQAYYSAMQAAVNYAFCNRQMIMHWVREVFSKIFSGSKLDLLYDVCHNVAKVEKHDIGKVCVHRKGATRSFGPGRVEVPEIYRSIGQPVLIPGTMGTASYVMVGTKKAEEVSFGSTAHGAGRAMSRHGALKQFRGEAVKKDLEARKIEVKAGGWKGLSEESPGAYKDIDEVVKVSHEVGIGNLVVRVVPAAVMKG